MPEFDSDVQLAGPLLTGLRALCVERAAETGSHYLTRSELAQIDRILAALNYTDSYGAGEEWTSSFRRCLFG